MTADWLLLVLVAFMVGLEIVNLLMMAADLARAFNNGYKAGDRDGYERGIADAKAALLVEFPRRKAR